MKKLNLKKIIAMGLITTSILGVTSIGASAYDRNDSNWRQDRSGYWYAQGSSYATGWTKLQNNWYYFDKDTGYAKTGWFQDNDGSWYYFLGDGTMSTTTVLDSYGMSLFNSNGTWAGYAKSSLTNTPDTSFTFEDAKNIVNKNHNFAYMGSTFNFKITQGGYNNKPKEDKVYTFQINGNYYSYRVVGVIDTITNEYMGTMFVFESGYIMDRGANNNVLLDGVSTFDETTFDSSNVLQTINTQTTTATKTQEQLDQEEMDRMSNPEYRKAHIDEYNKLVAK